MSCVESSGAPMSAQIDCLESIEMTGRAEYTAATFVGAPKRVPIRYRLRG